MRNSWTKTRKRENAYYTVELRPSGWTYYVLKVWSDPRKPFARAFCLVTSPMTGPRGDMGDVYAADVPGLIDAWTEAHTEMVQP